VQLLRGYLDRVVATGKTGAQWRTRFRATAGGSSVGLD
jgi:hypothetical protein